MNACACCKKSFNSRVRRNRQCGRISLSNINIAKKCFESQIFELGQRICFKCRIFLQREKIRAPDNSSNDSDESIFSPVNEPTSSLSKDDILIEIEVPKCTLSESTCIVCGSKSTRNRVPKLLRLNTYITRQFYIPENARCCASHHVNNMFYDDSFSQIKHVENSSFLPSNEVKWLLSSSTKICQKSSVMMSFKLSTTLEKDCYSITGFNNDQFHELLSKLTTLRNTDLRSRSEAVAVFLSRLRHNVSYDALSSFLSFRNAKVIENICNEVENAFMKHIVPFFIGCDNLTRHKLMQRQTLIATSLFSADVVLIADGTYAYHQKSGNNIYQRKSYNVHKHTHLCKPFTMCTSDGYIVDMFGPYEGNVNDATILKHILSTNDKLVSILSVGDVFVLDRGFRDCLSFVESKGYSAKMPSFLDKDKKQLTRIQANQLRVVTKARWVVEAVHGILKQKWKILSAEIKNQSLPKIKNYFSIAGALHNMFGKILQSDKGNEKEVIEKITNSLHNDTSEFHVNVESQYLRKVIRHSNLSTNSFPDFPILTENEMKLFCLGSYQMTQAISYLTEHYNGIDFKFKMAPLETNILAAKIQSRHVSNKEYKIFIKYDPNSSGIDSITGHYCTCKAGLRTLGCCAHVAAVILYLGHLRYNSAQFHPARKIQNLFCDGKAVIPDDSEDDSL